MITAMKRFFLLISLIFSVCSFMPAMIVCAAEPSGQYAVAAADGIWLYSQKNEDSGLFVLPYTYYVRVLEHGDDYCSVIYGTDASPYRTVSGYCRTEDLTFVDFVPSRPFLQLELTVTYTLQGSVAMGNGTFSEITRRFHYYGTSYLGTARYFYVLSDGVFDYIPATQEIVYDFNTDYLTDTSTPSQPTPPTDDPEPVQSLSALQITLICVVAFAVLAVAFIVLRGKRVPAPPDPAEF